MAARSTWRGAIDFGGFSIHLAAYNLVRSKSADSFTTVCPCHQQPVVMPRTCAETGDVVDLADCSRAVKYGGTLQVLPDEAVEAIKDVEATKTLTIAGLPSLLTVPLHLGIAHYRLVPDEKVAGSEGPANVLWNGLDGGARALVTEWVPRSGSRNGLLTIHADTHGLNGTVLPYVSDFNAAPEAKFTKDEQMAAMFEAFATQQGLVLDDFHHADFVDAYGERRQQAIDAALAGQPIEVKAAAKAAPAVPDLMAAMTAALESAKAPAKRARPKAKAKA